MKKLLALIPTSGRSKEEIIAEAERVVLPKLTHVVEAKHVEGRAFVMGTMQTGPVMRPEQCLYWREPEQVTGDMKAKFEIIETYLEESHQWRYLLKCRECGHLYFFEFLEFIDWQDGDDPQYSTYVPVSSADEALRLSKLSEYELIKQYPRLVIDRPKGKVHGRACWMV